MRLMSIPMLLALAFALAVGFAAPGLAQSAPAEAPKVEPPPQPDPGTTAQPNCIDQNSEYTRNGKRLFYVMTFENKCEVRMRCAVFAYLLSAKGPSHGRITLTLGPKSQGAAAKKAYTLRVKGAGGFSTSDRECRAL